MSLTCITWAARLGCRACDRGLAEAGQPAGRASGLGERRHHRPRRRDQPGYADLGIGTRDRAAPERREAGDPGGRPAAPRASPQTCLDPDRSRRPAHGAEPQRIADDVPPGDEGPLADARSRARGEGGPTGVNDQRGDQPSAVSDPLSAVSDPLAEGSSGEEGIEPSGVAEPAPGLVAAVPEPPCRVEAGDSENEPEDSSPVSAQMVAESTGSVDSAATEPGRQNGVLGGAPASENPPPGAPEAGEGDDPSGAAPALPGWATAVPKSACRRADSLLNEEAARAADGSGQVVDHQTSPVEGCPAGPGRQNGVPSGAPAPVETPPGPGVSRRTSAHSSAERVGRSASEVIASWGLAAVPLRGANGAEKDREKRTESSGEARPSGSAPPNGVFRPAPIPSGGAGGVPGPL